MGDAHGWILASCRQPSVRPRPNSQNPKCIMPEMQREHPFPSRPFVSNRRIFQILQCEFNPENLPFFSGNLQFRGVGWVNKALFWHRPPTRCDSARERERVSSITSTLSCHVLLQKGIVEFPRDVARFMARPSLGGERCPPFVTTYNCSGSVGLKFMKSHLSVPFDIN